MLVVMMANNTSLFAPQSHIEVPWSIALVLDVARLQDGEDILHGATLGEDWGGQLLAALKVIKKNKKYKGGLQLKIFFNTFLPC